MKFTEQYEQIILESKFAVDDKPTTKIEDLSFLKQIESEWKTKMKKGLNDTIILEPDPSVKYTQARISDIIADFNKKYKFFNAKVEDFHSGSPRMIISKEPILYGSLGQKKDLKYWKKFTKNQLTKEV